MTFILPVLIVLAIAAVLGFILAFVGEKFEVKKDERLAAVEANLAGVNCGACGFTGCAAFAEALVKGEVKLDKCRPTSAVKKEKILEILGEKKDA
ncbi:MAG TPA: (Fe-S)-binding protein [Clostridia bacterium]